MQGVNEAELQKVSDEFISQLQAHEASKDWKVKEQKPLTIYTMQIGDRVVVKASNTINLPFETVLQFFSDPIFNKNLQDNIVKAEVPYSKDNIKVIHIIMKLPGPISNRQIVAVNTIKVLGDKAYCGNRSCNFPIKLDKDCELAEVYAAGFILEKVDGKTRVTNISDIDVKGSIPGFVKNGMASKRAQILVDLENTIKKAKK